MLSARRLVSSCTIVRSSQIIAALWIKHKKDELGFLFVKAEIYFSRPLRPLAETMINQFIILMSINVIILFFLWCTLILAFVSVTEWEGETLELTKISRLDMGAYLCIASNGVPPSVSKRIKVSVDCKYSPFLFHFANHDQHSLSRPTNATKMIFSTSWANRNCLFAGKTWALCV